ncbi:MAG: hypothetical protein ACRECA_11050 [Pseudolabrys sp.]
MNQTIERRQARHPKAVITAWSEGAWAMSRHAADIEMHRAAARNTTFRTTVAVQSHP